MTGKREVAQHLRRIGEQEPEPAFRDHLFAFAAYGIADASFGVERHIDLQSARWRANARNYLVGRRRLGNGLCGNGDSNEAKDECGGQTEQGHAISSITAE